jgi:ABC-type Na+ efflux pump permease subunit
VSTRRVRAILHKELREYRRKTSVVVAMATVPLIFLIQPMIVVFGLSADAAGGLAHGHVLVYLLGIPAIVPMLTASYAVVGEREQGTLEPVLTTPVRPVEFLLGKALAALLPSVVVSWAVFAVFVGLVELFADPAVAAALLRWPQVVAQVLLTPLVAGWSIWLGMGISTRAGDIRVAQQLSMLACLPTVAVAALISVNVIPLTRSLAIGLTVLLLVLDYLGGRLVAAAFNRERLIASR